jgi:hypothetical protein
MGPALSVHTSIACRSFVLNWGPLGYRSTCDIYNCLDVEDYYAGTVCLLQLEWLLALEYAISNQISLSGLFNLTNWKQLQHVQQLSV